MRSTAVFPMLQYSTFLPRLLACVATAIALATPAQACTLWAAAGPSTADGGTLLSKNRDWTPGQTQVLQYRSPRNGIPYFGLYAVDGSARGLKQGVNAEGLSVVTASASSIPRRLRVSQVGKHGVVGEMLERYATVDEVAAHASSIFAQARPMFFMVSDRHKILVAEVGLDGRYAYQVLDHGTTAHTNHFLQDSLADMNLKVGRSSSTRYARITRLLGDSAGPYDAAQFATISRDRHDGPDDSLWRNGREATLSSWIIDSPTQGPQVLHVVLDNPGVPETTQTFVLDRAFWAQAEH